MVNSDSITKFYLKYNAYQTSLNLEPVKQNNNRLQLGIDGPEL